MPTRFLCRGCRAYRPSYQFRADHHGLCRCCDPPVRHKTCTECGHDRPITDYHIDRKARDGRRSVCRHCRNAYHHECYERRKSEHLRRKERVGKEGDSGLLQRLITRRWT